MPTSRNPSPAAADCAARHWSADILSQNTVIGKCLLHKLQTFRSEFDLLKEDAGEVAGRSREARHITARERIIIDRDHHDRLRAGGREGGLEGR
jgi:hypothetical protein